MLFLLSCNWYSLVDNAENRQEGGDYKGLVEHKRTAASPESDTVGPSSVRGFTSPQYLHKQKN